MTLNKYIYEFIVNCVNENSAVKFVIPQAYNKWNYVSLISKYNKINIFSVIYSTF